MAPQIETLILANHAEAHEGLLYIHGGGWTDHTRAIAPDGQPMPSNLAFGVTILTPWGETNRRTQVRFWIESEDGGAPVLEMSGEMEAGRPAGAHEGADIRSVLAFTSLITFPTAGGYRLMGQLGDQTPRSVSFRVHDTVGAQVLPT